MPNKDNNVLSDDHPRLVVIQPKDEKKPRKKRAKKPSPKIEIKEGPIVVKFD